MLFKEPLETKKLTFRNRIVMPPMATSKAVDGAPPEELVEYYRARARGTGLVIVEHAFVTPRGKAHASQLSMADDSVIPAYKKLTEAVHREGAKIIAQISHAGIKARDTGMPLIAPSAISFKGSEVAEAFTQETIKELIEAFAKAAARVKEAGYDGVEIHSAHGYLLNQFYSPITNKREDEYSVAGMENRTRIHKEVIEAVRNAVGDDYFVAIRFGAWDFVDEGSKIEDIPEAVRAFESYGIDLVDITGGMNGYILPDRTEAGYLKELSVAAKTAVTVPVILTGGVTRASEMETLLQEGAADLIGVGRAMLKDAEWSEKALKEC